MPKCYCVRSEDEKNKSTTRSLYLQFYCFTFKVPMNRKLFFFSFIVCLEKYTLPKFEKFRLNIDDFTSLQIRAFLPSKMVFESRGQITTWYQLLTSVWCHNRSRNMADKKETRQRGWYCVAGTPNQQSCFRNRWTCSLPYSLTCQQVTAQINSWHQSDVTAW